MGFVYTNEFFQSSNLSEVCKEHALHFIGMSALDADRKLALQMQRMTMENRNQFVPLARYMGSKADYGFAAGEIVHYRFPEHTTRTGEILEIREGSAVFKDVIVPLSLVKPVEPEQLSLFA